ncbi:MAG: glycosyltransferase [Pseudomonadota bacterium]
MSQVSARPMPLLLTVVVVVRSQSRRLSSLLEGLSQLLPSLVSDHEIIVVDNCSEDDTLLALKRLTGEQGLPNLQVYALTKQVDTDTASWVGIENALGDYVAVIDPETNEIGVLKGMLAKATDGSDVVFAFNTRKAAHGLVYRFAAGVFNWLYYWFNGIRLTEEAPQYRLLSKRVINFMLRHPQPIVAYRHLPITAGFTRSNLVFSADRVGVRRRSLSESVDRGIRLLVSTTRAPMRLVTALSLVGAISNLIYSIWIIAMAIAGADLAPGWVTVSLQQSLMFFLISLVLLVLGEYILHMASLSNEGPPYHIGQEFNSVRMTLRDRLNVDEHSGGPGLGDRY